MNYYAFSAIVNGICSLAAAIFIFNCCHARGLKWTYIFFCISVMWWSIFYFLWQVTDQEPQALFYCRMLMLGAIYIPISNLHHLLILLNAERRYGFALKTLYALSPIWFISTAFTPLIVKTVVPLSVFRFWPLGGAWFTAFLCTFGLSVFFSLYLIIKNLYAATGQRRTQLFFVFVGMIVGWVGGATNFPMWYGIQFRPIGNIFVSGYVFFVGYAIVKHHLMDMTVIIRKTMVYSIVTAVLTSVYVMITVLMAKCMEGWIASPSVVSSATGACAMALLFHPLRMRIQRFVDRHFFRESLDQAILKEATSGFVHEIKRPLAKISLPAELSLMDLQDLSEGRKSIKEVLPKVLQRLRYILDQTADAGDRIEAVREVSFSGTGQAEALDLAEIIQKGVAAKADLLERHHVVVKLELDSGRSKIIGRAKQLEIVVMNLIKNAVEAMVGDDKQGERVIRIISGCTDATVTMHIQDSGPGIKPENLPHLFEPYFTTKGSHGMGMGLFLCCQIVQAHGGTIEARTGSQGGAEFILSLPGTKI